MVSPRLTVVAAVIERGAKFLVTLRLDGSHLAGHWEFPGGKCHPSETHEEALRRELFEELDIVADVAHEVHRVAHVSPEYQVQLHFYRCTYCGEPKPMLGQEIRWVTRGEMAALPFPEADAELIGLLTRGKA